jgi:hypothetical protein
MHLRIASSLVALTALMMAACTSDDGSHSGDAGAGDDGGPGGTGASTGGAASSGGRSGSGGSHSGGAGAASSGGSSGSGGGSSDGGATGCTASGTDVVASDANQLSGLSFVGDRLAFLSNDLSLTNPATIDTVRLDGTGRTTIHTPTGQRRVSSLVTAGSVVYFLELNEDDIPVLELFSVPVAGGTATRLGTDTFDGARFVGADDTNLYLEWTTDQPAGAVFARVSETSGTMAKAATQPDVGSPFYPQVSGDSVFFVATTSGDPITTSAYGFPKDGANVTPTKLWSADPAHDTCYLSIGGFVATPTKLVCGLFGVESHARTGGPATVVIPKDMTQRAYQLVASDGENLYLDTPPESATAFGSLYRVPTSGSPITPIACDVHDLANHLADGTFPIQVEFEVITGDDQLYWIEKTQTDTDAAWSIRHAAK